MDGAVARSPGGAEAQAKAPYLSIRDLVKQFGAFQALKGVSLDIGDGEFVCFLGPSGCGKTTLLRAIAGLDIQTSGTIHQAGKDISALPPAQRDFGIVFQSYALFPNLSVADNIGYGLRSRGVPKAEAAKRVGELLQMIGLPEQAKKYPAQISGGQQQRVALARAIAMRPGLLLLDEPLSALDARVRLRLRHEIKELQRKLGVTAIMVTHDQEEALTIADRIVVMNQGVIDQVGTPEDVYRRPATAFVADFVGTMNFLEAVVAGPGRAKLGAAELDCEIPKGAALGGKLRLAFRPEDARVGPAADGLSNRLETEVVGVEFLGSYCRAALRPLQSGETRLLAEISSNMMRDLKVAVGQRLAAALPAEYIRAYTA